MSVVVLLFGPKGLTRQLALNEPLPPEFFERIPRRPSMEYDPFDPVPPMFQPDPVRVYRQTRRDGITYVFQGERDR